MKKTKIKQRIENARNAFLDDEILTKNDSISFVRDYDVLRKEISGVAVEKSDASCKILKQTLLFFPGTFLLWSSTLALSFNYFVWQPQNFLKIFFLIGGGLLMIGGIGDLKNPKHLAIPFSGIAICALPFIISLFTTGQSFLMGEAVYFFPLVLVVPFLAKGLVDRNS